MNDEAQGNGQAVVTEDRGGGVRLVRINRPEVRNALNMATRLALADAFGAFAGDRDVRAIVLTGDEKAFAAGADLRESIEASPSEIMLRNTHLLWRAIEDCPKPIIAAVNSPCMRISSSRVRARVSGSRRSGSVSCRTPVAWRA